MSTLTKCDLCGEAWDADESKGFMLLSQERGVTKDLDFCRLVCLLAWIHRQLGIHTQSVGMPAYEPGCHVHEYKKTNAPIDKGVALASEELKAGETCVDRPWTTKMIFVNVNEQPTNAYEIKPGDTLAL